MRRLGDPRDALFDHVDSPRGFMRGAFDLRCHAALARDGALDIARCRGNAQHRIRGSDDGGLRCGDTLAHAVDQRDDLVARARRAAGELLHLARYYGEAAPGVTGTRRFDGGVERQQVGSRCDVVDLAHQPADVPRAAGKVEHRILALLGVVSDSPSQRGLRLRALGDVADRVRQSMDGVGNVLGRTGCLRRARSDLARLAAGIRRDTGQRRGGSFQGRRRAFDGDRNARHGSLEFVRKRHHRGTPLIGQPRFGGLAPRALMGGARFGGGCRRQRRDGAATLRFRLRHQPLGLDARIVLGNDQRPQPGGEIGQRSKLQGDGQRVKQHPPDRSAVDEHPRRQRIGKDQVMKRNQDRGKRERPPVAQHRQRR